jgi:acetyl esterase/lipase
MIVNHEEPLSRKMKMIIDTLKLVSKMTKRKLWSFIVNKEQKFIEVPIKHKTTTHDVEQIKVRKFGSESKSDKYFVYFHGGGFVFSGNKRHYNFITNLCKKGDIACYYVDYPLAPEHKALDTLEKLKRVITEIKKQEKDKELMLMGDSAGANLALVLSKSFKETKKVVLMSPWLDISMTNPDIDIMEKDEIMFSKADLLLAANHYQGHLELDDPRISPLYDDFSDKEILIISGTDDILFPDTLKFSENKENVILHQYHYLPHDFMFITSGKEQNLVINDIITRINQTGEMQ